MKKQATLTLTTRDYEKLTSLVNITHSEASELLEEELTRATIVADDQLPSDVVAMNSKVNFKDLDTNKESEVILVYPHDANIEENKVSILAPVGSALIGLKVGQTIKWPMPNGKEKNLQVTSVTHLSE